MHFFLFFFALFRVVGFMNGLNTAIIDLSQTLRSPRTTEDNENNFKAIPRRIV